MLETPQFQDTKLSIEDRVATLTFLRDDLRNALTGTRIHSEIVEAVDWLNGCEQVSALIMTGSGNSFSAGGNIKDMADRKDMFAGDVYELQNNYRRGIQAMALAMDRLEIPAVAAINGAAVGAGFDLACMCDVRLAAKNAVFGETFINLGIIPGDGGAWLLQRLVGQQRAADLTFAGRMFKAEDALRFGLVLEVLEPDELMARETVLAGEYASKPPRSVRLTKRLMKAAQRMEFSDLLALSAVFQGMSHLSDDHSEAMAAFFEKRSGKYSGR